MKLIFFSLLTIIVLSVVSTSCKKDTEKKDAQVNFVFSHYVGTELLEFDNIKYTNAAGNNYSVSTLKYFVSDFILTKTDGSKVIFDEAHYIDAADASIFTFKPSTLALAGDYQSLSFIFGLNEEKNISGSFLNPPESNMEWPLPMGGGYHYMKLEGKFDSTDLVKNYQAHMGRLMGIPHFINVTLPAFSLTVDGQDITFNIKMDINNWWETPNTFDLNIMSGVMGNETIQQQLQENGADVFSYTIE